MAVLINLFISCFFIFISACAYAQSWAPPEAIWSYNYLGLGGEGYVQITYVKDTVLDAVNCKRLNKRLFQKNAFTGTVQSYNIGSIFTYENNGIVYIRYNGVFDTLYHFNAVPGETWNVPGTSPVNTCNAVTKIEVLDTATVLINNVPLRRLIVHYQYQNNPSAYFKDTLIERIGSLRQYMVPWDICLGMVDGNEGGALRCYTDNVVGEFKHNFYSDCSEIIGMYENISAQEVIVSPNPVSGMLQIIFIRASIEGLHISLSDAAGKELREIKTHNTNISIDFSEYPSGIYFLKISGNHAYPLYKKIQKF
jgi:hypothetical protein